MLNDSLLGDRLNAVKEGNPIPEIPKQSLYSDISQNPKPPFWVFILNRSLRLFDMSFASFLYGFAIKTIFFLDWSLFGAFAVGFLINHVITLWPKYIFPKLFKN